MERPPRQVPRRPSATKSPWPRPCRNIRRPEQFSAFDLAEMSTLDGRVEATSLSSWLIIAASVSITTRDQPQIGVANLPSAYSLALQKTGMPAMVDSLSKPVFFFRVWLTSPRILQAEPALSPSIPDVYLDPLRFPRAPRTIASGNEAMPFQQTSPQRR